MYILGWFKNFFFNDSCPATLLCDISNKNNKCKILLNYSCSFIEVLLNKVKVFAVK